MTWTPDQRRNFANDPRNLLDGAITHHLPCTTADLEAAMALAPRLHSNPRPNSKNAAERGGATATLSV